MRHEERTFFRSRFTANTALEGVPSTEQADSQNADAALSQLLLEHRPFHAADAQVQDVRHGVFRLLMRTAGYLESPARRKRFSFHTWAIRCS